MIANNGDRLTGRIIPLTVAIGGKEVADLVIEFLRKHEAVGIDDAFEISFTPEEIVVYSYAKDADGEQIMAADGQHLVFETQVIKYRKDYDYSKVSGLLTKAED